MNEGEKNEFFEKRKKNVDEIIYIRKKTRFNKIADYISIGLIAFLFFVVGFKYSEIKSYNDKVSTKKEIEEKIDFSYYYKAWKELEEKHIYPYEDLEKEEPTEQDKVWWSIKGLANSYRDPYTDFFPPVENKEFKEDVDREFFGIGMEVEKKNGLVIVVSPLPGTPSFKAGLKPKDIILKIDGKDIANMSLNESVKKIRGDRGTKVTLTIVRKGIEKPFDIDVFRDLIQIPTVKTHIVNNITVISIYTFGPNTAEEFYEELKKFSENKNNDKLVVDLRLNPGGYMMLTLKMASFFIDGGKVILEEKGKKEEYNNEYYADENLHLFNEKLKLVVLVNEGSASASEIFAGILSDYKRAIIVGKRSFGKGSVQEAVSFTKDTSFKMTVAKWFLPSGASVSKIGIIPDIEIDLKVDKDKEYKIETDTQILKSIEILNRKDFFEFRNNKKTEKEKQEIYKKEKKEKELKDKKDKEEVESEINNIEKRNE